MADSTPFAEVSFQKAIHTRESVVFGGTAVLRGNRPVLLVQKVTIEMKFGMSPLSITGNVTTGMIISSITWRLC